MDLLRRKLFEESENRELELACDRNNPWLTIWALMAVAARQRAWWAMNLLFWRRLVLAQQYHSRVEKLALANRCTRRYGEACAAAKIDPRQLSRCLYWRCRSWTGKGLPALFAIWLQK